MGGKKKELTLEENFARLEEVIEQLEQDDLPLETAFQAYQDGMLLLEKCNSQIERVEKQVLKLSADGQLDKFAEEEEDFFIDDVPLEEFADGEDDI